MIGITHILHRQYMDIFRRTSIAYLILSVILVLGANCTIVPVRLAEAQENRVGTVYSLEGSATVMRGAPPVATAVQTGDAILPGDTITVEEIGRIAIRMENGAYVRLSRGSSITFPVGLEQIVVDSGDMHYLGHASTRPTIATPHVTAAIRGTEIILSINSEQTTIAMLDGTLEGRSEFGTVTVQGGQGALFKRGVAPFVYTLVSSADAAQWTMYVPLFDTISDYFPDVDNFLSRKDQDRYLDSTARASDRPDQSRLAGLIRIAREQGSSEALGSLDGKTLVECSSIDIARARLLLTAGDQAKGIAGLERCRGRVSGKLGALTSATLSLVNSARGQKEDAMSHAAQALNYDSESVAGRIAVSVAFQSKGEIERALAALHDEAKDDSVTRARRAELEFARGHVEKAKELLASIPDRDWYTETIQGYVHLGDRDREAAAQSFNKAISLEPSAGLPRAGLGLVKIGEGDIEGAKIEFEKAVHLEPLRSSFRSYLAKAYFEDDRSAIALSEFAQAIKFDSADPTPHLYRSFVHLSENQPVAALEDLNTAFALRENRAVYRSEFLLDQDDAVTSASLARVYRDLGFVDLGRVEAIRALSIDYTNAGAHRLLAESQDTIFLADSALSERRAADLFAPLSINVADSIGSDVSLNEYSALFERDGSRTAIGTVYDSFNDNFSTGILSLYKQDNAVIGASATGAIGRGVSDEPSNSDGRFGLSIHGQPTWADRYLIELRGGIQDFEERDSDADFLSGSVEGAYLHRFSPYVTGIIQSKFERERREDRFDAQDATIFSTQVFEGEVDSQQVLASLASKGDRLTTEVRNEAQLIATTGALTSILSFTSTHADINDLDESEVLADELGELDGQGVTVNSAGYTDLTGHAIGYLGDYEVIKGAHVNFGGEFSSVQWASRDIAPYADETESDTLWSPKAGLVLAPTRDFMFRVGYAETQGKGRFGDFVTIAPTLVGGITQRFNDLPGTHARTLGFGLDGRPIGDTYVGAEWTKRWLREPNTPGAYEVTVDFDQEEVRGDTVLGEREDGGIDQHFARGYIYNVVTQQLVIGADYRLARQNVEFLEGDLYVQDQRASSFSRYFWDSGFFATTSASYRYQDRENSIFAPDGSDAGWMFSVGGGYRIPERKGLILLEVANLFSEDVFLDESAQFERTVPNDLSVRLAAQVNF